MGINSGECSVAGCSKSCKARGLCGAHYQRLMKHGDVGDAYIAQQPDRVMVCSIADCERPKNARGWCSKHYMRWYFTGDPLRTQAENPREPGVPVSYTGAHARVRSLRGPAKNHQCEHCSGPARDWAYDNTDPDELREATKGLRYSQDPAHYLPLCGSCHVRFDFAEREARGIQPRRKPPTCGTRGGYKHGCRCDPCRAADAKYSAAWRARRKAAA